MPHSMQENILFGNPYDEERYRKGKLSPVHCAMASNDMRTVIYQCGLKRDLTLLEAGDATEVGEKGLTLR